MQESSYVKLNTDHNYRKDFLALGGLFRGDFNSLGSGRFRLDYRRFGLGGLEEEGQCRVGRSNRRRGEFEGRRWSRKGKIEGIIVGIWGEIWSWRRKILLGGESAMRGEMWAEGKSERRHGNSPSRWLGLILAMALLVLNFRPILLSISSFKRLFYPYFFIPLNLVCKAHYHPWPG